MRTFKALALAITLFLPFSANAQAESGPSKIDIAIVWTEDNCEGLEISEATKSAAEAATAGMSEADHAAKAAEIETAIAENFGGDRVEYCAFIEEMAAGL